MNYFRKLASGKRNRYKAADYDLDMTYITPRIIAMSFPASGMEKLYRNPIEKVAQFLQEKHDDNYLVFNFSDRKYNYAKFDNKVVEYEWRDHHAPKIVVLFDACKRIYEFLQENEQNVVVVHWNAGKGRTGTSIAWFLMYWGLAENATDAINYYGWKRFSTGKGVSQPCQLRYIHYFEAAFKKEVLWSVPKILESIIITTVPKINQGGWKPYVDICNGDYKLIHTTKNSINLKKYKSGPKESEEYNVIKIVPEKKNLVISGDAHFFIKHKGSFNNTNIWRFSVNTGFIDNKTVIPKEQISPDSVTVSKKFHENFRITLVLRDYCDKCSTKTPLNQICERCKLRMAKATKEWERIYAIVEQHEPYPSKDVGEKLWFYDEIDYHEITNKKLVVKWDQYNLIKDSNGRTLSPGREVHPRRKGEYSPTESAKQVYEEAKHRRGDDDFKCILTKEERNTMFSEGKTLEEDKNQVEDYFRSVNEFSSK